MRIKFTISLMLALIFCSSVALAAKLQVPSHNYPTIQDGIDAASDGDIVIVADGVFTGLGNKDLDFNGKAITVKSKNGPENCIIDCEDAGRGFIFGSSEGPDSVLSGITITNGNAWFGAGIQCQYASPTIQNMIIKGNTAQDGPGGGIYLDSSDAIIIDSIISENSAGSGAGIDCGFSWAKISKCTISDNVASKGHAGIYGGNRSNLTISSCIISNNLVTGGGDGAGVSLNASAASLINCMIVNNSTNTRGAGIQIVGDYTWINPISSEITNCTVASNNSPIAAGLYIAASNFPVTITNSIIWGNTPEEIEIANSADPLITYSDVKGGWPDLTNINSDPLFFGLGDYHLTAGSPCMNTGTFDGAPDYDLDGVQRPQGAGYDMGAYECTDTGPTLDVTYPDGGETLIKGNDYLIKWSWSDYSGLIRIHVYLNDVFYYPISNGIDVKQGRKGVEFNPPITWDNSDYYKIHISTLDDQGSDESDGYFTIQDEITVYDYDVPYINQLDYAQWGQSACGPTCITMLLRYWYPNNKIDVPEVYHAATQANSYYTNTKNGAPLIGYYNVGWAVKVKDIWQGTDPDTKLDRVPAEFRKYHIGTYSGMDTQYAVDYLKNIWGAEVKYIAGKMGDIIDEIKKNPVILSVNEEYGKHFIVLRGYNAETNTFYINDPYAPYHDEDDVAPWDDADNIEVSYNKLQTWFKGKMMTFKPSTDHNQEVRENTVLVDNGINNFGDKDRGNLNPNCKVTSHCFEVETIDAKTADGDWIWQSYHTKGMDWIYPIYTTEDGYYVKWTPKLPVSGQYEVIVKFYGDKSQKTSVQYDIYDNLHTLLHSQEVDQSSTGYQSVSLGEYYLSDGAYVKVEDLPSSCNADAIMFKYVPTEAY